MENKNEIKVGEVFSTIDTDLFGMHAYVIFENSEEEKSHPYYKTMKLILKYRMNPMGSFSKKDLLTKNVFKKIVFNGKLYMVLSAIGAMNILKASNIFHGIIILNAGRIKEKIVNDSVLEGLLNKTPKVKYDLLFSVKRIEELIEHLKFKKVPNINKLKFTYEKDVDQRYYRLKL